MTNQEKLPLHSYTVALSFHGEQLEPSELSAKLNLQPSHSFSQQQSQSMQRKRTPFWSYNGQGQLRFQDEWESLEEGLIFLLQILNSRKAEIISLAQQFDAVWWVGHFQGSFDGGPTLSPKLMAEISTYEIPLSIDNYFSDE